MIEFLQLIAVVFVGSVVFVSIGTAFAIGMGWLPGVNFDIAKEALKQMYKEIFKK